MSKHDPEDDPWSDGELSDDDDSDVLAFADEGMLIGLPEELEPDEVDQVIDVVADARARLGVDELLGLLVAGSDQISLRDLFVLSDLTRVDAETVEETWPRIAVERRRRLLADLIGSQEEFIELELGRLLRITLRDPDSEVRRISIEGLWEEVDTDLVGPLVRTLQSDDASAVRAAAAAALGAYVLAGELDEIDSAPAMRVEQALLEVLHGAEQPLTVKCRALESLAYSGEAGMRQLIEDAYYSQHEEMRLSAIRAMGRSADIRWRTMVRAELDSPDASMRAEAARACGELEVKSATAHIVAMLEDAEKEVRLAAIDALGHLGGKQAREALRAVAAEAEVDEADAAEIALDELLFYDDPGAVPLLEDEDEGDDEIEPWRRHADDE